MAEALILQNNPLELGNFAQAFDTAPMVGEVPTAINSMQEDTHGTAADSAVEAVTASYEPTLAGNIVERARSRVNKFNKLLRRGGAVVLGSLALGGMAETASAQTTGTPEVTSTTTSLTIKLAGSQMSEKSLSKATLIENYRTIAKAKLIKAEQKGDCVNLDGTKRKIWTQGHTEAGHPYGRDTRTSRFCKVAVNGATHWYRKACGNAAVFKVPKIVVQHPFWVKNINKAMLTVSAKSQAHAKAECKTDNTSALAEGRGSAKATAWLRARNVLKGKKLKEVTTKEKLKVQGEAQSKASAKAVAICVDRSQNSTATPPETPPETPPKDGTPGAGSGTTGTTSTGSTDGGSGAGGTPGNTNETHACYDPADSTNGDGNPDTTGSTMYSNTTNDQFGYCTSPAQPAVNG